MSLNQKITIEEGAKLDLNGGKITSSCGFWDGIEMEGNPSLHQVNSNATVSNLTQPGFISSSNAIIENATIALKTYTTDTQGNIHWNSFGGVVNCTETHFINNWRSAAIMKYQNFNPSDGSLRNYIGRFEKCTFNWDSNFVDTNWVPQYHVSAWGADGLLFSGNTFKNDFFNKQDIQRLIGINTIDASIYVDRFITNPNDPNNPGPITASTFQDLNTGIKASSPSSLSWNTINKTTFENNHIGVYLLGSDLSELTRNNFLIPEGFVNNEGGQGIRIEGSSSINIEGNTFSHSGNTNGTGGTVGIYSINADPLAPTTNSIYRNTFSNLQRSVQLSNGTGPFGGPINPFVGNTMTQIDCNTFRDSATYYNFYASIYKFSGALGIQGECLTATDPDFEQGPQVNLFQGLYDETQNQWQAINFGTNFQYNSYPFSDVGIDTLTWFNNNNQFLTECGGFTTLDFNQACPNNLDHGGPFGPIVQVLQNEEQVTISYFLSHQDEEDLIALIQSTAGSYQKEQELLQKSPYLTDAVLIEMVNSNLPNYRKNNILQPHYPVSDQVIENMLNSPFTITPYILRDALVSGAGVKEDLLIQFFKDETQPNWAIAEVAEANSPLTDSEILAILNRKEPLEPYRLWKFLQWNTPLSMDIMNAILNLDPPTAQWVINKINASTFVADDPENRTKKNKNALQLLEEQLQQIKSRKWYYMNKDIRNELTNFNFEAVNDLLENDQSLESDILQLALDLKTKNLDFTTHINNLISIANERLAIDPKDEKGIELLNVCAYYSLLHNAQSNTGEILNLEESDLNSLLNFAEQGKSLSGKAKGLLDFYGTSYEYHFMEPLKFPNQNQTKSMEVVDSEKETENTFIIYPNPNNGNFILSGTLPESKDQVTLRIMDITGRMVKLVKLSGNEIRETIYLNESNGTYLYELRSVNEVLERGKIVINR